MSDGVKIIGPHRDGCLTGDKPRTYVMGEADFRRDKIGRRGGSTLWYVFHCNDPKCPARVMLRWDVLADILDAQVAAATSDPSSRQRSNDAPSTGPSPPLIRTQKTEE